MQIWIALIATAMLAIIGTRLAAVLWPTAWSLDGGFLAVTILCFVIWGGLTAWALMRTES